MRWYDLKDERMRREHTERCLDYEPYSDHKSWERTKAYEREG